MKMGELLRESPLPMMEQMWHSFFLLFIVVMVRVHAQQNPQGFISIDCGITKGEDYTDDTTNINYTSDAQYIDTGTNHNVSSFYTTLPQESTLRSFANGTRNCYKLNPVKNGRKYLVRASFLHGNYDDQYSKTVQFELHLGANLWKTLNISDTSEVYRAEALTVASDEFIWVCLVNTGHGTPFISSLELRPLKSSMYPAVVANNTLVLSDRRFDLGSAIDQRYPTDRYDRIWSAFNANAEWSPISTSSAVSAPSDDPFVVPSAVMQTASTPANGTELSFGLTVDGNGPRDRFHCYMHVAEIQSVDEKRSFDVFLNGDLLYGSFTPSYLLAGVVYSTANSSLDQYNFSIKATNTSLLPPILNALEVFTVMRLPEIHTHGGDVEAITAIKAQYQLKRNWMGDPCAPRIYAWDGLNCSYSDSNPPRIITLNMSSSGLTGEVSALIANLTAITYLDLSYNNITGILPNFLAELSSLRFLNLRGNQLNGSIPSALLAKSENGELMLSIDGNPNLCIKVGSCERSAKKSAGLIIVIVSVVSSVLLLLVVFAGWRFWSRQHASSTSVKPQLLNAKLQPESRQFTYDELGVITRNYEREIGRGGFGTVFHGYLENGTQVAVKLRSQGSPQGTKEFLAEAQLLTRVYHKNLVSLVGYCQDGIYMALVYEYMAQGSLQDHLRDEEGSQIVALSWGERVRISLEAAHGLEYLHKGCSPPVIHRDVKTSNILLNHSLEAKLADFGLSKAFESDAHTHVSTVAVVGTLGYLDPEYHRTLQLSEKSDVYAFGVVLLVLITGKSAILTSPETGHVSQWVRTRLERGDIGNTVDARLRGEYDVNSAWKIADVAMSCTADASTQRPTMADVVVQLKEGLALEVSRQSWNHTTTTVSV